MKKIKLLMPVLGLTAMSSALMPLAGCSCTKEETEKVIPDSAFSIKDVTLKGFKEGFEYASYTKLVIPSNVKVIDEDAFNGLFTAETKVKEVVIPGNVETIRKGAFANNNNITVYDFSSWTVDQIHVLKAESGAFALDTNGIYSYVKMGEDWTDVQKELLKEKLMGAGIPNYCFIKQSTGNVELASSSEKEQVAKGGSATNVFKITGHYSSSLQYKAVLTVVDSSDGADIEHNPTITLSSDFKSVTVNAQMVPKQGCTLDNGDYVTYKVTLICYTESTYTAQWSETIETFKLTYNNVPVSLVTEIVQEESYKAGDVYNPTGVLL